MNVDLPVWANQAINESCQSKAWNNLIENIKENLKNSNKIRKRFSNYTEAEQALLVEEELKLLQVQGSESLNNYNHVLNAIIDDKLMDLIVEKESSELSNVQQLLSTCSRIIIGALESSPHQLKSTTKLFINREIPEELRSYLWSSTLDLNKRYVQMLPLNRISPSLDVILSRRCHVLLDSHFHSFSVRSSSALLKSVLVDFMKRNHLSLPSEDIITLKGKELVNDPQIESNQQNTTAPDFTLFDRLFFLTVVLCSVFPGPILPSEPISTEINMNNNKESVNKNLQLSKPQYMLSVALQCLLEERHLYMFTDNFSTSTSSTTSTKKLLQRPPAGISDMDGVVNSIDINQQVSTHSPFLAYTRTLISHKNEILSDHLLTIFSSSSLQLDIVLHCHSPYVKSLPHPNTYSTVITYFYDILINESLLRGLSGLLSLSVTQFVWDQCFIFGFNKFLPIVCSALVLGAGVELISLTSGIAIVETFVSYCSHASVETIQRLLTEYCKVELQDLFDVTTTYSLDYHEDTKLLQAICRKLTPNEIFNSPISRFNSIDPKLSFYSPSKQSTNIQKIENNTISHPTTTSTPSLSPGHSSNILPNLEEKKVLQEDNRKINEIEEKKDLYTLNPLENVNNHQNEEKNNNNDNNNNIDINEVEDISNKDNETKYPKKNERKISQSISPHVNELKLNQEEIDKINDKEVNNV